MYERFWILKIFIDSSIKSDHEGEFYKNFINFNVL